MARRVRIKVGDEVIVCAGREKGRTGKVAKVLSKEGRAVVAGVNMSTRHLRQTAQQEGGIRRIEAPVHLSNLALADPKDGKPTRIGIKFGEDGKKVRFAKRSGEAIDG